MFPHFQNHTSIQRHFKSGVPQGDVFSPTLFNNYPADLPQARATIQVMSYVDCITITSTHTNTSHDMHTTMLTYCFTWIKHNNLTLYRDKTTCTLFTPDTVEYKSNLELKRNNTTLPMATHPKELGLTLDPKLTYITHIHSISIHAHKPLQIIKTLTQQKGANRKRHTMLPKRQS